MVLALAVPRLVGHGQLGQLLGQDVAPPAHDGPWRELGGYVEGHLAVVLPLGARPDALLLRRGPAASPQLSYSGSGGFGHNNTQIMVIVIVIVIIILIRIVNVTQQRAEGRKQRPPRPGPRRPREAEAMEPPRRRLRQYII